MDGDPDVTAVHVLCINTNSYHVCLFAFSLLFPYLGIGFLMSERYYTMVDLNKDRKISSDCVFMHFFIHQLLSRIFLLLFWFVGERGWNYSNMSLIFKPYSLFLKKQKENQGALL